MLFCLMGIPRQTGAFSSACGRFGDLKVKVTKQNKLDSILFKRNCGTRWSLSHN